LPKRILSSSLPHWLAKGKTDGYYTFFIKLWQGTPKGEVNNCGGQGGVYLSQANFLNRGVTDSGPPFLVAPQARLD